MRAKRNNRSRVVGLSAILLLACGCPPHGDNGVKPSPGKNGGPTAGPTGKTSPNAPVVFELWSQNLPTKDNWKCDPVLTDVNEDGHPDLIAFARLGSPQGARVWLGDGRGNWRESSEGLDPQMRSCGGGLAVADLNGDGHVDLAVADHCQGVFTYLGDGRGHWRMTAAQLYPEDLADESGMVDQFIGAEDLDVGDINGDGHLDIVAGACDEGGLAVYLGDGTGENWKWTPRDDLPANGWANRVHLSDMNADGLLDLVVAWSDGPRVWLGDGRNEWTAASEGLPSPYTKGLYRGLAVGDVNRDGRLDFAVANWVDGPEVYLQQEDGSWQQTPDVFPEMLGGAVGLAMDDVDGDGHLDIVCSGRLAMDVGMVYGVYFLHGRAAGGWQWVRDAGLPETGLMFTWGFDLADVDRDGLLDIAVGSGGIIATGSGPPEPVLDPKLIVWHTRKP